MDCGVAEAWNEPEAKAESQLTVEQGQLASAEFVKRPFKVAEFGAALGARGLAASAGLARRTLVVAALRTAAVAAVGTAPPPNRLRNEANEG
jgi:hypothetical protein